MRNHQHAATSGSVYAWRAFLDGLVQPSPLAIGLALSINIVGFAALALLLTPGFLATRPAGLLAEHATDYDAFVTSRVIALGRRTGDEPLFVMLGGSTTRAALLESDIADGLRAEGLAELRVVKLCTSRQSLWETLALAENLPAGSRGVVLIGIGPALFATGADDLADLARHPRLGIRSTTLDAEFRRRSLPVGPRSGIYPVDNAPYVLARLDTLLKSLLQDSARQEVDSRYVGMAPAPADQRIAIGERVDRRLAEFPVNRSSNLAVLDRIVETIRSRTDLHIVLVEAPLNPEFVQAHRRSELVAEHRAQMSAFARARDIEYVLLNESAALLPADFHDWGHLADRSALRRSADAVLRSVRAVMFPARGA